MAHLPEREGRMTRKWAEQYTEEVANYRSPKKKHCQYPQCPMSKDPPRIFDMWVMRSRVSGDVKEIGSHCHQRWLILIYGQAEPWFEKFLVQEGKKRVGHRFTPQERMKLRPKAWEEHVRNLEKKGKIALERVERAIQIFKTSELADKYAKEHGGYVHGIINLSVKMGIDHRRSKLQSNNRPTEIKKFYVIFINPKYKKGDY